MNNINDFFRDEFNNIHSREKVLGAGGQGIVFRTKDPNVAIKLLTNSEGEAVTDKEACERYFQKIRRVRMLPLPSDIHIAAPAALLKGTAGYVMQLLTEMVSFTDFWIDGKTAGKITSDQIPKWLGGLDETNAKKLIHYAMTGGLRRRLNALSKCASVLAQLHGFGLVYGDISPNNAFISSDPSSSEVWLIDADNLRHETRGKGSCVYTPKYGAPELVQEKDGGRFRTDCHAFAVMAFYMLTLVHPFEGALLEESDWASEGDDEMSSEEKAYAGLFPWIDDEEDDSNCNDGGLPRMLVLTEGLRKLFQETFEKGRTEFWKRPSIYHWTEVLAQAADKTIVCPSCGMSWYQNEENKCPYCDEITPSRIIINTYDYKGETSISEKACWTFERELLAEDTQMPLPYRVLQCFNLENSHKTPLSIGINNKGLVLKIEDNSDLEVSVAYENEKNDKFHKIYSSVQLPKTALSTGFYLFVKGKETRLLKCTLVMEDKA